MPGWSASGFGTGLSHPDRARATWFAAADDCGLAVLEVPRQTPFIALSRAVSAALAAEEYAVVARTSAAQQELTRAALAPGAPATVVDRLARYLDGWALLVDAAGTPLEAAPPAARRRAADLGPAFDRLRGAALRRPVRRTPGPRRRCSCSRSAPAAGPAGSSRWAGPGGSRPRTGT